MCTGLTLSQPEPRRPAAYGASRAFTTTPSWPAAERRVERRLRRLRVVRSVRARRDARPAPSRRAPPPARESGSPSRSAPSRCRRSKKQRRERRGPRAARAEPRGGDLERLGPAVVAQRDRLAVEHERTGRQRARQRDHLGQPRGDVVERAREDRDVVAVAVHLHPRAVELRVDERGRVELGHRGGHVGRRPGEHRGERPPDLEADRGEPVAALGERDRRDRREVAAQRQRAAHRGRGHARGPGHGVGHHARERALAQVAEQQPDEEGLLVRGRPAEQRRPAPRAARRRALARRARRRRRTRASTSATVSDGAAAGRGRLAQQRVADADLALGELAREPGDHRGDVARRPRARAAPRARAIFAVRAGTAATAVEAAATSASSSTRGVSQADDFRGSFPGGTPEGFHRENPPMANLLHPDWDAERDQDGFRWRRAFLGRQAGARQLGASLFAVPPGGATFPLHAHLHNEELLLVLAGRPTLARPRRRARAGRGRGRRLPGGPRRARTGSRTARTARSGSCSSPRCSRPRST